MMIRRPFAQSPHGMPNLVTEAGVYMNVMKGKRREGEGKLGFLFTRVVRGFPKGPILFVRGSAAGFLKKTCVRLRERCISVTGSSFYA